MAMLFLSESAEIVLVETHQELPPRLEGYDLRWLQRLADTLNKPVAFLYRSGEQRATAMFSYPSWWPDAKCKRWTAYYLPFFEKEVGLTRKEIA